MGFIVFIDMTISFCTNVIINIFIFLYFTHTCRYMWLCYLFSSMCVYCILVLSVYIVEAHCCQVEKSADTKFLWSALLGSPYWWGGHGQAESAQCKHITSSHAASSTRRSRLVARYLGPFNHFFGAFERRHLAAAKFCKFLWFFKQAHLKKVPLRTETSCFGLF